jgi:hypothetical protein
VSEKKTPDHGQAEVEAKMDEEQEKGYHGVDDDPLKPDGYTLAGSVARAKANPL